MERNDKGGIVFSGDELPVVHEIARNVKREAGWRNPLGRVAAKIASAATYARRGGREENTVTIGPEDLPWFAAAAQFYGEVPENKDKIPTTVIDQIVKNSQHQQSE